MSEVKPVETTEAAPSAAPAVEPVTEPAVVETKIEEPVAVETKTEEPTAETPAAETTTAETTAETPAEDAPKEIELITEGVLETKFLSAIPLFIRKQTCYFGDEPCPEKSLAEYLKKDKSKAALATYAHATQTGKGLLFLTKTDKTKPTNIVVLDGADITTQGEKKFTIKSGGHEFQLEAPTGVIRERWVHTLKLKIAESEGVHAAISETEGFKTVLEKLTKPVVIAPLSKKEEPVEDKEGTEAKEATEPAAPVAETEETATETPVVAESSTAPAEKKEEKKRSSSKNRLNRFSFFGKKEEKDKAEEKKVDEPVAEDKEETPAVTEPESVATETATATEPAPAPVVVAPTEEAGPPSTTEQAAETTVETPAEVSAKEETSPTTSPVTSPKANRKSFLGGIFRRKDEKKTEVSPAEESSKPEEKPEEVAAIQTETPAPISEPAPITTENVPDEPQVAAVEQSAETTEAKEAKDEASEPRERKTSLFGSLRRDKSTDGEDKPRRSLSFWKKEKKPAPGKEETPIAETEAEPSTEPTAETSEPVKTETTAAETKKTEIETPAAPQIPDAGESEVKDGRIGDVVPEAVTVVASKA
ncbi:hypothetical protein H072_3209 [Dactylellina haptotyla CBS 200.50]|uniref:Meiotic expression up-regulated protein 6 PH domain-containing protein n=1 Tax=Dactylellina haptotyla (strain CBS 200.50) TaxID=1284197 RepID=S8AIU6_DACHA|nr:hypothetical protein H072_3209 [Dactylellina haptotyla CBS 200.50]